MEEPVRAITWEAPAHSHIEKSSDWFWALGIIAVSAAAASFFFGNFLLALLILLAGGIAGITGNREPEIVEYAVTTRGIRVDTTLYPYSTLEAFYIDDEDPEHGPQLLARSKKMFMHLIVIPLPEDTIDEIDDMLETRLPEEFMEEPLAAKMLEIIGF